MSTMTPSCILVLLLLAEIKAIVIFAFSPCVSGPCIHGVCKDVKEDSYQCYCINGYTGLNCQTNYDDCRSKPCQHGATCIDGIASFTCLCAEGYTGQLCEDNLDDCSSNPCQNEGVCYNLVNGYRCECLSGYKGEHCEEDIDVCSIKPLNATCLNGGICVDGPGDNYTCSCPVGFIGEHCEEEVDECRSSPCLNNGTCVDKPNSFKCICPFGWTGKYCETKVMECEENHCENGAICLVEIFIDGINMTDPTCYCVPDYHGLSCEHRYNECLPFTPCMNRGICVDGIDSFTCRCHPGYTGIKCENPCTSEICGSSTHLYSLSLPYGSTEMISTFPTIAIMPETPSYGSFTYVSFQASDVVTMITDIIASFISSPSLFLESSHFTRVSETMMWTPLQTIFDSSSFYMPVSKSEDTGTIVGTMYNFSEVETYSLQLGTTFISSSFLISSSMDYASEYDWSSVSSSITVNYADFDVYSPSNMKVLSTEKIYTEISTLETVLHDRKTESLPSATASYLLYPSTEFLLSFFNDMSLDSSSIPAAFTLSESELSETMYMTTNVYTFPFVTLPVSLDIDLEPTPTIPPSEGPSIYISKLGTALPAITSIDLRKVSVVSFDEYSDFLTPSYDSVETSDSCSNCFSSYIPSYSSDIMMIINQSSATYFKSTYLITATVSDISDLIPSGNDSSVVEITTPVPTAVQNITHLSSLCEDFICENGGTPLEAIDLNRTKTCECLCPLHAMGIRCEEETTVHVPQFLGKSFLKYSLPETSVQHGLNLDFNFRTVVSQGLLFYTELPEDRIFILLYIDDGLLKLNFSCGQQIMVFSESNLKVDNGFYAAVSLNLWITKDSRNGSCTATLHVNNSAAMSGQQLMMHPKIHFKHLYLGGLPMNYIPSLSNALKIKFFDGCMKNLQINEEEKEIVNDAVRGAGIVECKSGMCAFQPCWNEGKCVSNGENWHCICKMGYTGLLCEHMNCDANPCEHGGTCLPLKDNMKFICLCPYGYHSINCEKFLAISRPSFHGDVLGYSSFIQYSNKVDIQHHLHIELKFTTTNFLQDGLLLFTGQQDVKDPMADYMALSLERGHIVYYINLGSGYRWLQSASELNESLPVHTIYFGHHKRYIWLGVDNQKNISGLTPGKLGALNTIPYLFIGGHASYNFTLLPSPIAQLNGFKGCIFDVGISNSQQNNYFALNNVVSGRNVQQCNKTECELTLCENGGTCVDLGTTFECLCSAGWAGPKCSFKITPCSAGTHHCAPKSTCVVTADGYQCDCTLGQTGIYCNETNLPPDPHFNGRNSFMEFKHQNIRQKTDIKVQVKPKSNNGLLFYATQQMNENSGDFAALTISDGYVNFCYNLGTGLGTTTTLQNPQRLTLGKWHTIVVRRFQRDALLTVDNIKVSGKSPPVMVALDTSSNFFIGGLPDLTAISNEVFNKVPTTYKGCISYFEVNNKNYILSVEAVNGRNIDNCDGTSCGLYSCKNGGSCVDHLDGTFSCNCLPGFSGLQCDISSLCFKHKCQNGGVCIPNMNNITYTCDCLIGWTGGTCENAMNVSSAKFSGSSFIYFWDKHYQYGDLSATYMAFNFSSKNKSGLLMWSGKGTRNDDYLGAGLQNGQLKIVWNLGWLSYHKIITDEDYFDDSQWHSFVFQRYKQEVSVDIDGIKYSSRTMGNYNELNTNGQYYFGGFPKNMKIQDVTNKHFGTPLYGCIKDIILPYSRDIIDIMNAQNSSNIKVCD